MRTFLRTLSICTVVAAGLTPVAAHAGQSATTVSCGQTITVDTTLANDLVDCPATGLVIGADHVTIDLAGHTIDGTNSAGSEGIADDGYAKARIRDGSIKDFFLNGIGLRDAPHSKVEHVRITDIGAGNVEGDAAAGVLVKDSAGTRLSHVHASNDVESFQSDGVDVLGSPDTVVKNSTLAKNSWNGLVVIESPRTHVTGNRLLGNRNQGMEANAGADGIVVKWNLARDNVANGLVVGAVSHARISQNALSSNGEAGLFMFDLTDSSITHNRARGNDAGIILFHGQFGSTGNRLAGNDASRNLSVGIVLEAADANRVVGNVASRNQGTGGEGGGIIVAGASDNVLRSNVASHNLDVGIGVFEDQPGDTTGNVLKHNTANRNGNHGINAVAGTVDGGGNRAHGNTPLPNCLGVVCS